MVRFIGVVVIVVLLVAAIVWAVPKSQVVSATPTTEVLANLALVDRAQLDTSTANAQETATADIQQAHNRATSSAATATQNAMQTQALLQQTQLHFSMQLTSDSATTSAGATATRQQQDAQAASTTTAIAGVIATQTQSFVATQQGQADLVRASEVQQQNTDAFFWAWGPPLFLLAVVAICLWAFWYWEIRKRVRRQPAGPIFPHPAPPLPPPPPALLPLPEAEVVVVDPVSIVEPDGEVSGWLEEVKEKLLAKEEEEHVNPNL